METEQITEQKPDNNRPYLVFTGDTPPEKAKTRFVERFGKQPENIWTFGGYVWAGPIEQVAG